ncbi:SMC family ATPase [Candidatus Woesearchaeota archaeon]|nr:SMC family ATPase [Candidatus Woesearchaeota archaeon]
MILKSVKLRNIRSYTNESIDFPEGSILLSGDIGAGKSSILQAAEFALFGPRRDSISGEALLRKGEKTGDVEIGFLLDGKEVVVRRGLKRGTGGVAQDECFISVDGRKTECTATELKARVLDLLGYPQELLAMSKTLVYRYTVYTPQEEMKQILFEDDEARVDTLRKVFGIDKYRRISQNAALYVKALKDEQKELKGKIADLDIKKKEHAEQKEELQKVTARKDALMPELKKASDARMLKRQEVERLGAKVEELAELRKKREVLTARAEEMTAQQKKARADLTIIEAEIGEIGKKLQGLMINPAGFPAVHEVSAELERKETELQGLRENRTKLEERQRQVLARVRDLETDRAAKSQKVRVLDERKKMYTALLADVKDRTAVAESMEELDRRLREMEKQMAGLTVHRKQSLDVKEQISSLDRCPTCKQDVSSQYKQTITKEEDSRIAKLESEIKSIEEEKGAAEAKLSAYRKKLEHLAEKERQVSALRVEVDGLETAGAELDRIGHMIAELEKEKADVMQALARADSAAISALTSEIAAKKELLRKSQEHALKLKERDHALQMLEAKKKAIEETRRRIAEFEGKLTSLAADKRAIVSESEALLSSESLFQEAKKELEEAQEAEKKLAVQMGQIEQELRGVQKILALLDYDIKQKEKSKERLVHLGNVQEWVDGFFVKLMGVVERNIMAKLHTQFSELFVGWFNMLIEDDTTTARLDEEFTPVMVQNGYDTDIRHLSGGEKTSVALAYRLALNKVINDVIGTVRTKDILILDEPTDGFSSEQLDKVREVLDELDVKQTIIVSHESKIESFVDHVVRVVKEEHVSRVVG